MNASLISDVTVSTYGNFDVLRMSGRVDSYTAPTLHEAMERLIDKDRTNLVFDMTNVDFLSSKGINVLFEIQHCCRLNGGKLVIAGPNRHILDTFDLIQLTDSIEVYANLSGALSSF